MARALLGYVGNANEQLLNLEIARLRRRVTELEAEVTELRAAAVDHSELDLEFHRIAEAAEPALT